MSFLFCHTSRFADFFRLGSLIFPVLAPLSRADRHPAFMSLPLSSFPERDVFQTNFFLVGEDLPHNPLPRRDARLIHLVAYYGFVTDEF